MVTRQGEAIRRKPDLVVGGFRLRVDGDGVSEGLESGDESAGFFGGVYSTVEVVGAEVCVGFAGGKHVPDDDGQFVRDGDDGFVLGGRVA